MLNKPSAKSRVFLSVIFAALTTVSGLTSCGAGSESDPIPNPASAGAGAGVGVSALARPIVIPPSIAAVQAAWIAESVRGTEYFYCDCGTGAEAGCVVGNDTNAGTSKSAPRRTITNAVTLSNSIGSTLSTISFCKGGAFDVQSPLWFGNTSCPAGNTCRDLREYEPTTFTGTAAPLLFKLASSVAGPVFNFTNGGGVRVINLKLSGSTSGYGIFLYNGSHDVHLGNLRIEGFPIGIHSEISGQATLTNIKATGNVIIKSTGQGFLGAADGLDLNYNYFGSNGGSNNRDHSIYLSADDHVAHNVNVVGNYIYDQYGPTCRGALIVAHGAFATMNIALNHLEVDDEATTGGCWGISLSHGGYPNSVYFRNTTISGNTVINAGNLAISSAASPGLVVENNLVIQDWLYGSGWSVIGIGVPVDVARTTPADDVNNSNVIRNNTIWFGPSSSGGGIGIRVANEGTGHSITNNSVNYSSPTAGQGVNCFELPLTLGAYGVMNNNHCHSTASNYKWEKTNGATLAAWQTHSGFDANSIAGSAPQFVNATSSGGHDFRPIIGSPLIGTGDNLNKSTLDKLGATRPNPPDFPAIGAYEP